MCYDSRKFCCEFEILGSLCVPVVDHKDIRNPIE
jgi:hypothetical protein